MRNILYFLVFMIFVSWWSASCTHDPIQMDDLIPIDTTGNPIDTMIVDTMIIDTMSIDTMDWEPCDPDIVYFEIEILPILQSNCAFSNCHDAASAEEGVILESYESVIETADIEPFNLNDSELFEVLIDTDEDERMPPNPTQSLSQDKIQLIATWILQGAKNLECDPNHGICDTVNVSFQAVVLPTIQLNCEGCHSGNIPAGGLDLTNYNNIKSTAITGKLVGTINWDDGFQSMPQDGNQLAQCTIDQIKSWVDAGAPDN